MSDADFEREKAAARFAVLRAYEVPPRLIGLDLPWRTRARLWLTKHIDHAGVWLCDHHHSGVAELLWRACGLW